MSTISSLSAIYEFGPFRLDTRERVLLRAGELVPLTPKAIDTLVALVQHNGRVVEKDELLKEVWPGTFVEEATLAQNIFTLRKALGKEPSYIETVPRRGYRFSANVRAVQDAPAPLTGELPDDAPPIDLPIEANRARLAKANGIARANGNASQTVADAHSATAPVATREPVAAARKKPDRRNLILIAAALTLAVGGIAFGLYQRLAHKPTVVPPFQSMEITRMAITGKAIEASISPSGKVVVYIERDNRQHGLWVKQVATASAAQNIVPPADAEYFGLRFSPDEEYVYFVGYRADNDQATLYMVPTLGGTTRKILTDINSPVTFSPDGRRLAFTRICQEKQEVALMVANADGSDLSTLATRQFPYFLNNPAWSPDGKLIACGSVNFESSSNSATVVAISLADGSEQPLTSTRWHEARQMAWLADGSGLMLTVADQELSPVQIWRLAYPSGDAQRVTNDLNSYLGTSLTANSAALVSMQTDLIVNIWVAAGGEAKNAVQITSGGGKYDGFYGVAWTPDGRIVYSSIASGAWDIWIMNADGSSPKQLTANTKSNYGPAVSADGRYIVFVSNRGGNAFNVWRMDIDGGNPKQLTFGEGENFVHCTPDNRWVVYATIGSNHPGAIWKVPLEGGDPLQLTDKPSSWPYVSPDGKLVTCTYRERPDGPMKLALLSSDGGPPVKLLDLPNTFRFNTVWSPDGRAISYLDARDGVSNIWNLPIDGSPAKPVTDFKANSISGYDWSRAGKRLVCSRTIETTSVVMIKNLK